MNARCVTIVVATMCVAAACGSSNKDSPTASCIPVTNSALTGAIKGKLPLAAVKSGDKLGDEGRTVWYLASPSGALWATDADPAKYDAGQLVPINKAAGSVSGFGGDVSGKASIYGNVSPDSSGAKAALVCASK